MPPPPPTPIERPKKLTFLGVMPLWLTFVVSLFFLNNYWHAADGLPLPVTVEELATGHRPPGHYLRLTGFVDARNGVSIETTQRGVSVDTDVYIPVVSRATPEAPVAVLVRPQGMGEAIDQFAGMQTFDGVTRDVLWEGLSSSHRSILEEAGVKLAPEVLVIATTTPKVLLRNALVWAGVTWLLAFLMLSYSYRYSLREWQAAQSAAGATSVLPGKTD